MLPRFGTKVLLVCGEGKMSGIAVRRGEKSSGFPVVLAAAGWRTTRGIGRIEQREGCQFRGGVAAR